MARASQPGIVVLGMHRSGTSLVAELVQRWCAYGREEALFPGDAWNARGYWEYGPLVDLNQELLRAVNSSWDVPPADTDRPLLAGLSEDAVFRSRALRLLEDMQAGGRPWFWKDPRLPILLPFWKQLWGGVLYVAPVRDPVDIALSLQRRDGFSISRSLLIWQRHMSEILLDQEALGAALFLSYEKLLADGIGECNRLCGFLEERLGVQSPNPAQRSEVMAGAIVPELRRSRTAVGITGSPVATPAQKALYSMLEDLASGSPVELAAAAGMEPHWREHLIAESSVQARAEPKDSCEVFWRSSNSPYIRWRRRSVPVKDQRGPQSLRIELPSIQENGETALRIDLSQQAGFAKIDELAVKDNLGCLVWAWDGRPESIQSLSMNQIRFCARQPKGRGCMVQLDGDDPWLEVVLDAFQSAALAKGATVALECEYIPSQEYLLEEDARMIAELRESSARLDELSAALQSAGAHVAAGLVGIEERVMKLAAGLAGIEGRITSLAANQVGIEERVTNLAAGQLGIEERVTNLVASQPGIEGRITSLAANQVGIEERATKAEETGQAILQSRIWRLLATGGGLVLRFTGAFTRRKG